MRLMDMGLPFAVLDGVASMVVPTNHKHYSKTTKLDDYDLTACSGPPDLTTMIFTPKKKPKKDKFILFWVYGDSDDKPYIIRNPPKNLDALLIEWNGLDAKMSASGEEPEGWDYVNKWLKKKGVDIIEASAEIHLDDYPTEAV